MTVLSQVSGLPISVCDEVEDLLYSDEDVDCGQGVNVSLREIAPSLLNKALLYPELVYKCHRSVRMKTHCEEWPASYQYDVVYLPDGLLGIEYIKTHIFYGQMATSTASIIQVFTGQLTIMLQKNRKRQDIYDIETHVEEAMMVDVEPGMKVAIPAGYFYTFVNTGPDPVVFARVVAREHIADYEYLRRENGLAYYIISKNARKEIVVNPRYRTVPDIKQVPAQVLNTTTTYKPQGRNPLYSDAINAVESLVAAFSC